MKITTLTQKEYNSVNRLLTELRKNVSAKELAYDKAIDICIGIVKDCEKYRGSEWFFASVVEVDSPLAKTVPNSP